MRKLLFLLVPAILLVACCKKNPDLGNKGVLKLNFKGRVDGQPLVLYNDYTYFTGEPFRITTLRFFITDVRLVNASGEVPVLDVANIDFYNHHSLLATAPKGEPVVIPGVTAGAYQYLRFVVGVDSILNATDPSMYPNTNNPLSDGANYWEAWHSYIHERIEGKLDTVGAPTHFDLSFLYHIGRNMNTHEKMFTVNVNVPAGDTTNVNFLVDVKRIFSDGTPINFRTDPFTHTPDPVDSIRTRQYNLAIKVCNNFSAAITQE